MNPHLLEAMRYMELAHFTFNSACESQHAGCDVTASALMGVVKANMVKAQTQYNLAAVPEAWSVEDILRREG